MKALKSLQLIIPGEVLKKEQVSLIRSIQKELHELANDEIAAHSQRFFKTGKGEYGEGDQFLGIRVPVLRKLLRKYKEITIIDAAELLKSPFHEQRLLALLMLVNIFRRSTEAGKKKVYDLYITNTRHINSWDLVDCSAEHIVGSYLLNRDKSLIYKFCRSSDLWKRRIAVISTFHFIKNREFKDTLKMAEILLKDREDLIHKAVGWMLREIGNRDRLEEENFLVKHYKDMPRTMLRYAIEKFPEEKRQRYIKGEV